MRILITNDDGINAPQLVPLVKWAQKLGEVMVVAPKVEQSGKSHGIELHKSFEAKQVDLVPGVTVWAVDSTPADCVRLAVLGMKKEFDLVISGVNRGLNIGSDIIYSGTVSAVMEAWALGIKAFAVSTSPEYYPHALEHMDRVYDFMCKHKLFDLNPMYNINIPAQAGPIRITRQGGPYYSDDFAALEDHMFMPMGKDVWANRNDPNLDTDVVLGMGGISITPLTMDRTNHPVYEKLLPLSE